MSAQSDQPNILFVFSDQHRWCDLGCYGNDQVYSPNFDAFETKALRFNNCISNSPLCVPARGSLLTGLSALKHRAITNDLPISQDVTSIAHVLNENGYHTGYIGKWHLAGVPRDKFIPEGKGRLGFKEWKVCNCNHAYMKAYYYDEGNNKIEIEGYEPAAQTSLALDFITRNCGKKWSLFLSWGPPHDPYTAVPARYLEYYRNRQVALRPNVPETIRHTLDKTFTSTQMKANCEGYYAHISALDEQFGRLMDTLEKTGQMENTVVVYTSDHGDMLGSQGVTNKQWPYEESIKVPLLVYWKGRTVNAVTDELIGLVDLPVSLLGLIGLRFPDQVDGNDLHRLFTDRQAKGLEACYIYDLVPCHQAAARGSSEWRGLRTRQYTYARTASDEGFALYDNVRDPYQRNNLIDDPEKQQVKVELMKILDIHINTYDKLLPWDQFVREFGFTEEWNRSQAYFGLPLLE